MQYNNELGFIVSSELIEVIQEPAPSIAATTAPTPDKQEIIIEMLAKFMQSQDTINNNQVAINNKLLNLMEQFNDKLGKLINLMQNDGKLSPNKETQQTHAASTDDQIEISIDNETKSKLHGVQQYYVTLNNDDKKKELFRLLNVLPFKQAVIFRKSVSSCKRLCKSLNENNLPAIEIHPGIPKNERLAHYKKFKEGQTRIVVATKLFECGMNVARANIVFNYDMPENTDTYLERMARDGEVGAKCLVITFVADGSDAKILNEVQSRFAVQIAEMPDEVDMITYMENELAGQFGLIYVHLSYL
ncbi:unnamed protein product [Rotaria sp. Silwood1]|nr:unnamed protein product [Rotaria sp. Silwood1]CAF3515242.1 unnamed protein product [Rotaria sp. Silwood1]CAF4924132.1 unnamed protein product [Rotaria sp. Silwood1]